MSSGWFNKLRATENRFRGRRWLFWSLTIIFLAEAATAYGVYAKLTGNVRHIEVTREDLGSARPSKAPTAALNILVVGSDQRDGTSGNPNRPGPSERGVQGTRRCSSEDCGVE